VSVWGIFPHSFPGMDKKILLKTYFKYVKYILSTAGVWYSSFPCQVGIAEEELEQFRADTAQPVSQDRRAHTV
jgi:hypothetical protein